MNKRKTNKLQIRTYWAVSFVLFLDNISKIRRHSCFIFTFNKNDNIHKNEVHDIDDQTNIEE